MNKVSFSLLSLLLFCQTSSAFADNPKVKMETSLGEVIIELYPDKAPKSVENFLGYTNDGAYDGTIFHRVMKGFMNQGGGFTTGYQKKPTKAPIKNEADNGLKNKRGTIAMARTGDPHSATNQFFINTVDNAPLDHVSKDARGWGYTVFAKVIKGMDVMDKIANARTTNRGRFANSPVTHIVITRMTEIKPEVKEEQKKEEKTNTGKGE